MAVLGRRVQMDGDGHSHLVDLFDSGLHQVANRLFAHHVVLCTERHGCKPGVSMPPPPVVVDFGFGCASTSTVGGILDVNSHKHRGLNSTLIGMEIVPRGYRWGCLVNDHRKEKEGK